MSEMHGTGKGLRDRAAEAHCAAWSLNMAEREGWDDMEAHNLGMTLAVLSVAADFVESLRPHADTDPFSTCEDGCGWFNYAALQLRAAATHRPTAPAGPASPEKTEGETP